MLRLPFISFVMISFIAPYAAFAQDEAPADDSPSAESATPYSESFTSGEVTPAPPPELDDDARPEKDPDHDPLNDPSTDTMPENFRIGVTGALEFPHIVNFGLETLMYQKYGFSIDRGAVSRNINGIDVSIVHTDLRFRYHPWGGSFFGGIALGQHTLTGEKSRDITYSGATVKTNVKITAKSNYVTPHIGWFTIWEPGFTMGLDLGWLFPVSPKTTVDDTYSGLPAGTEETFRNTAEYTKLKSDVDDSVQAYSKKSLPFVTMIRMGWMF